MSNVVVEDVKTGLPIVYGLFNFGPVTDAALHSLKYIYSDIQDLKDRYIKLGFHLWEFEHKEYFKDFGYDSFKDFCEKNIPLDNSNISKCIKVWYRFCKKNGSTPTMFLKDDFIDYHYSQLQEMVTMEESELKLCNPKLTVKQIRDIKKTVHINPGVLKKAIHTFFDSSKPFTRQNVYDEMVRCGKSWSYYGGSISYQFKPGKLKINVSKYYTFEQILQAFEDNGGVFDTEPIEGKNEKYISINDLTNKSGIVLYNYVKGASALKSNVMVRVYDSNGSAASMKKCDVLLSDDGNLVLRICDDSKESI